MAKDRRLFEVLNDYMGKRKKILRLNDILPLLPEEAQRVAQGLILDAEFMEAKLEELRKRIDQDGMTEKYQYGSKQTAYVVTYLQMQKQYTATMRALIRLIPQESNDGDELLDFIANKSM